MEVVAERGEVEAGLPGATLISSIVALAPRVLLAEASAFWKFTVR